MTVCHDERRETRKASTPASALANAIDRTATVLRKSEEAFLQKAPSMCLITSESYSLRKVL